MLSNLVSECVGGNGNNETASHRLSLSETLGMSFKQRKFQQFQRDLIPRKF